MPRRCAWRGAGWSAPASSTCRTRFVTKIESKNPAWARAGVPRSKAGLQKGGHPRTPWGTVGPANNGFLVLHERSSIRPRRVCLPPLCSLSPQRATHHAPSQASAARCRAAIQPGAVSHWNAPSCAQGWFWRGFPQRRREEYTETKTTGANVRNQDAPGTTFGTTRRLWRGSNLRKLLKKWCPGWDSNPRPID